MTKITKDYTKFFSTKERAYRHMKALNEYYGSPKSFLVIVDGPSDDMFSVMTQKLAIEHGFPYEYEYKGVLVKGTVEF